MITDLKPGVSRYFYTVKGSHRCVILFVIVSEEL